MASPKKVGALAPGLCNFDNPRPSPGAPGLDFETWETIELHEPHIARRTNQFSTSRFRNCRDLNPGRIGSAVPPNKICPIVQGSENFSRARKASPCATEVNSCPPRIFSLPNRFEKIRRTAGTKELPPVRNTRSTSCGLTPDFCSRTSIAPFNRFQVLGNPCLKVAACQGIRRSRPPS